MLSQNLKHWRKLEDVHQKLEFPFYKKKIIYELQLGQKLQKTILTHFWPMSPFYNPEIKGFLAFSVGIKRE